jgi:2'-5' RNA ligase
MSLLVLAFPELHKEDFDTIQSFRKEHDALYSIVEPHFTLVFPIVDIPTDEFIREITEKANSFHSIEIKIREAIIHKDELTDQYLAFLVPDEGYDNLVRLHDMLYSEKLKSNLRYDIPYVPHITIGKAKEKIQVERMVDKWNTRHRVISGQVSKLAIVKYENNRLQKLLEIILLWK